MMQELIRSFTQSTQGQTALSQLTAQGFTPQQAEAFMGAALPTAAQSMHSAQATGTPAGPQGITDIANSHYGTNFLSGAVSSLLRGQGLMGAAIDGVQGVAGGHVAEVIASRFGLPPRVAGMVGAVITPLAIDFLWERLRGGQFDLGSLLGGAGTTPPSPPRARWGGPPAPGGSAPPGTAPAPMGGLGALLGGGPPVSATVPGGLGGLLSGLLGGAR